MRACVRKQPSPDHATEFAHEGSLQLAPAVRSVITWLEHQSPAARVRPSLAPTGGLLDHSLHEPFPPHMYDISYLRSVIA